VDYTFIEDNISQVVSRFSEYDAFSFDLETTGLNPLDSRILLCQVGFPDGSNYVIHAGKVDLTPLMPFFASTKWTKLIQNAKFDTKFLLHFYKTRTKNLFDTMTAEKIILSNEGFGTSGLKALALKYLELTIDKEVRETFVNMPSTEIFSQEQLGYAARDVNVLWGIRDAQAAKLEELGMRYISELEFELTPIVGDMELVGVPVNVKKWREQLNAFDLEHEESRLRMNSLLFDNDKATEQIGMFVRDAINLNSPKQVKEAFQKIGINIDKTNEREISLVDHPAARELLKYRELQKIKTSYGASFLDKIHPFSNRIHPNWQQIGTATGRFACKDPNLQQMPKVFRSCVSSPDHVIVGADMANIELRILAETSGDPNLIKAFSSDSDPHRQTAAMMFRIQPEEVTPEQRFFGKTLNFGISYGMGPNKLRDMLNHEKPKKEQIGMQKTMELYKSYKYVYKRAAEWLQNAGHQAYVKGYSTSLLGRRRFFQRPTVGEDYEKEIASIKRQGANSVIQGSNADLTKLAMYNLYNDLKTYNYKADIILQVHDEIAVLAHKSQAENIRELVQESMMKSCQEVIKKVPVKVDSYINESWSK
jgi:DNA polymerase I